MPSDCELAQKDSVDIDDLADIPILISRHQMTNNLFTDINKQKGIKLNIVATYNLMFNASLMVEEGMGYAIGFDHIIDTSGSRQLTCRPISNYPSLRMHLIWKKYQVFTKAAQLFLSQLNETLKTTPNV